jgi:type IV pilus assembly protein PilO
MQKLDLKNPMLQKVLLSVLVGGGLLGVFFFTRLLPFGFRPMNERLSALKADYEKKSTELARARATVSDLPRFEAEYEHLHERWAMAAELLPTDRQLAALLRKITLAAQQTGVEFVVFRPGDAKLEQHYTELPLQVSVFGDYHQVGSFIAELANMRRIITVSNLVLKAHSRESDEGTTSAEFTASAYSLNASAASVPAPSPPPPTDQKEGEPNEHKSS